MIKLLSHFVNPFGFKKGKTEHFRCKFRVIYSFDLFIKYKGQKTPFKILSWPVVGGIVGYQACQGFCYVYLELVCHKILGHSGIWTIFDGELFL